MAAQLDAQIFQFDIWETLDEESMELTQTSEFWAQVQYEADRLDVVPPANLPNDMSDSDMDWSIMDTPEHKENIVHHDCMWPGSCTDIKRLNTFVPADTRTSPAAGESLLKAHTPRPDTPPSIDGDEPPQFRHAVDVAGTALRLLRDSAAVAADHSYTLARQQFDNLGVQTPSDSCESEEEIDVVSLGTSQQPLSPPATHIRTDSLPRVPSAQERQRIQHTVATAMSPRGAARKRLVPPPPAPRKRRGPGRRGRRAHTDTDSEAETPDDRRNIHNDMERLRRIGLKNLFDELKKQIPATRDKERAPKVVILREAATLCRKLRQEDIERDHLLKQQTKLMTKLKKLRAMVSARYRPY